VSRSLLGLTLGLVTALSGCRKFSDGGACKMFAVKSQSQSGTEWNINKESPTISTTGCFVFDNGRCMFCPGSGTKQAQPRTQDGIGLGLAGGLCRYYKVVDIFAALKKSFETAERPAAESRRSSEAKKEGVTQAASHFQLRRRDRPSRRRQKQSLSRAREVSDVLSLFHLYALRVGDDAQRANGKKSDSKPEERISKRHSLPPRVRRRYIANYRDGSRRALECVF
jgi:hypothetical protein